MEFTIKTRREAAEAGETKYFTGRPCSRGHLGPRYTVSGICCKCNVEATKTYSKRMHQKINARLQGHFSYALHPADHAAALAYCQALDLARGRVPGAPPPGPATEGPDPKQIARAVAAAVEARRSEVIEKYRPKQGEPYMPKP